MTTTSATKEDLPWICKELQKEDLCYDDLYNENVFMWKVDVADQNVGFYGLEIYDDNALLRSVVIRNENRKSGLGKLMMENALENARAKGIRKLYLLTFTASGFFEKLGFTIIPRDAVPKSISQTREFAEFCPDTAICMTKNI